MPRAKATKNTTETKTAPRTTNRSSNSRAAKTTTNKTVKTSTKTTTRARTTGTKTTTRARATRTKTPVTETKNVQKGGNQQEVEEVGKRYFKCIMINADGKAVCSGRYSGKKPKQAASKACTRLYKEAGKNFPKNIVFGMHECTRTSKKKKKYFYLGSRVKLSKPEKVSINKVDPKTGKNMVIVYNYNNQVRKLSNTADSSEYNLLLNYDVVTTPSQEGGSVETVAETATETAVPETATATETTAVTEPDAETVEASQKGGAKKTTRRTTTRKPTTKSKNLKVVSKTKTTRKTTKKTQ
jgi:hypothetical protein